MQTSTNTTFGNKSSNTVQQCIDAGKVSAIADMMLHLGEGCTENQLLAHFDRADLEQFGERARSEARKRQERSTVSRVPARRAA
ncbi:hypothetical protein C8J36_103546 [Rhizobium sp. PP-F2F-G48]|nr:hypothetical protein C8J36_103546 [Rhizobium sp. PP-F2F-G48]